MWWSKKKSVILANFILSFNNIIVVSIYMILFPAALKLGSIAHASINKGSRISKVLDP